MLALRIFLMHIFQKGHDPYAFIFVTKLNTLVMFVWNHENSRCRIVRSMLWSSNFYHFDIAFILRCIRSSQKFLSFYKKIIDAHNRLFHIILLIYVWYILYYWDKNRNVWETKFHVCVKMHYCERHVWDNLIMRFVIFEKRKFMYKIKTRNQLYQQEFFHIFLELKLFIENRKI